MPGPVGTFWNLTKIALQICSSVKPAKAAPETVNEALSPGVNPSLTWPDWKLPEFPVMKPKSSTTVLPNPCGTFPRSASEKANDDPRLGACDPVKPFRPEALEIGRASCRERVEMA